MQRPDDVSASFPSGARLGRLVCTSRPLCQTNSEACNAARATVQTGSQSQNCLKIGTFDHGAGAQRRNDAKNAYFTFSIVLCIAGHGTFLPRIKSKMFRYTYSMCDVREWSPHLNITVQLMSCEHELNRESLTDLSLRATTPHRLLRCLCIDALAVLVPCALASLGEASPAPPSRIGSPPRHNALTAPNTRRPPAPCRPLRRPPVSLPPRQSKHLPQARAPHPPQNPPTPLRRAVFAHRRRA